MDLTTLATRICAGLDGVRACVLLSGDGLTMAVYPPTGETRAREVWERLQGLGDPARGFMDVGEEVWVLLRRGPYTGVLVTGPGTKPGLLLDKLEFMLRTAEESRARDATDLATTPARPEGTRRPRTTLHGEHKGKASPRPPRPRADRKATGQEERPAPVTEAAKAAVPDHDAPRYEPPEVLQGAAKRVVDITEASGEPEPAPPAPEQEPSRPVGGDVDRVALAREFRHLLRDPEA